MVASATGGLLGQRSIYETVFSWFETAALEHLGADFIPDLKHFVGSPYLFVRVRHGAGYGRRFCLDTLHGFSALLTILSCNYPGQRSAEQC